MKTLGVWEYVESSNGIGLFDRFELPHGWLIRAFRSDGGTMVFIPKANKENW